MSPAGPSNWGRWGPDDEIGTANFVTPDVVLAAARLVRKGQVWRNAEGLLEEARGRLASGDAPEARKTFQLLLKEREFRPFLAENRAAVVRTLTANEADLALMGQPPDDGELVAHTFAEHPLVESFRDGEPSEGGSGATVAALKVS